MIDSIKNLLFNLSGGSKSRSIALALAFVGIVLLLVVSIIFNIRGQEEVQAPEFIPLGGPAVFLESDSLFSEINNSKQFELLRVDVKYYARQLIDQYKGSNKEVIFVVKEHSVTEREISLSGEFQDQSGEVTVQSIRKNYGVLETVIDGPAGSSSELQLPSLSEKNKFIGSLPQETTVFRVDYLERSDTFYVTFSNTIDDAALASAREYLQKNLNDSDLLNYNISAVGFTATGGVKSVELVPKPTE